MKQPKYIYNPDTCHYEPARITWKDVVVYACSVAVMASVFFVAIVFLHNRFVETDHERALRAENAALKQHKPVLERNLEKVEATLVKLQGEETSLYTRLFNEAPPAPARGTSLSKNKVLLADASDFRAHLHVLRNRSADLVYQSSISNALFSDRIRVGEEDMRFLSSIPSIQPVLNPACDKLASGFGKRINPFHKGIYQHPGIDFVAPRGTEVLATAHGKVTTVSKSNLQAGYGNVIVINHGEGFTTRYAHLEEIRVKPGQAVTKGMVIGTVGNSGGSVAPHLHYEIMHNDEHVDPLPYFMEGLTSGQHAQLVKRSKKTNQSLD